MTFTALPQHIYIFAAILAVLLLSFVIFSLLPSFVVSRQLSTVIKKLDLLKGKPDGSLSAIFLNKGVLEHLWHEYADSLHKQAGDGTAVRLRSTMPAGVIFRPDILVDIPLHADFFKHLPGLFTGVGIIGTFYGLLIGMKSFVVSEDPMVVRDSLTRLLHGVSEAFLISASAITLAMIVTFIEKLVVSRLNGKVEKLVQLLDGLFEGGAGEEYLARLVQASESSSTQTSGLLKGELKQILTELIEKQISAAQAGSVALGDRIAASIEDGMKAPLTEIAASLKNAENNRGAALQATLDNFSLQLKEMLGGQGSFQQQIVDALGTIVIKLEVMATAAGQRGTDLIAEQLEKSNAAAASREALLHEKLNEQITAMVEGINLATGQITSAVTVMHTTTKDAMAALNTSADTLYLASQDFTHAGQRVSDTLDKSAGLAGQLIQAADTVSAASSGLADMFGDYRTARDAMIAQVHSLQLLAEQVRRDASMSGEVLARIESATGRLVAAQKDADEYLSRISEVIGAAHQSFSEGMTRAVSEANREFHQALSDSVKLLREGIHELESTLDAATSI